MTRAPAWLSALALVVLAALPLVLGAALAPPDPLPFRDRPPVIGSVTLERVAFVLRGPDGSSLAVRAESLGVGGARTGRLASTEKALVARDVRLAAGDGSDDAWTLTRLQVRPGSDAVEWSGELRLRGAPAGAPPVAAGRGTLRVVGGRPAVETAPRRRIAPLER